MTQRRFHTPSAETETAEIRRADALVSLADSGCEGYEITLHVPANLDAVLLRTPGEPESILCFVNPMA